MDGEYMGTNLLEILTDRVNEKPPGEYTEEFENRALRIRDYLHQLHWVTYEIIAHEGEEEYQMDLMEDVDLLFRNELTGEQEYLSMEEAAEAFLNHVEQESAT